MTTSARTHRVYERELPGRGYVAIEIERERSLFRRRYRGRVIVERRHASRRSGAPPVVAEEQGRNVAEVMNRLLPAAECNSTIAAALLRRERTTRQAKALAS